MLKVLKRSVSSIGFLREIRKKIPIFGQVNLFARVDLDHLLVSGHSGKQKTNKPTKKKKKKKKKKHNYTP